MSLTAPLIDVANATAAIAAGAVAIDCRHDLADPAAGARAWALGHITGARHAHLDRDLSDLSRRGAGRHPLPSAAAFAVTLARWGVAPDTRVIAYDASHGAFAARLWWMLHAIGHQHVAVLDGGFAAWVASGAPVVEEAPEPVPTAARDAAWNPDMLVDHDGAWDAARDPSACLVDARAPARFRGDEEPIDAVAGHVPGALNRPFTDNLGPDGRFKPAAQLRSEFLQLLDGRAPTRLVAMCGSGVTACHNLLALAYAGLDGARLYAPSWSGWIEDRSRPVACGDA